VAQSGDNSASQGEKYSKTMTVETDTATRKTQKKSKQVKTALGQNRNYGGLTQVEAPNPNNSHQRVTAFSKETLEKACLDEARR